MRKRYSEETKEQLVELYNNGYKVTDICKDYEVTKSALYNWVHIYTNRATSSGKLVSVRDMWRLEQKVIRLTRENEIYKQSGCHEGSSLEEKLIAMVKLKDRFSVHSLCDTLEVRRSTFYHYLYRSVQQTKFEKDDEMFKPLIRKEFHMSKRRLGSKKIRAKLMQQGYTISPGRVSRLMQGMGLCYRSQKSR